MGKRGHFSPKLCYFGVVVVAVYLALESHTWNECDDRNKRSNDDGGGARRQNVMNTLIRRGRADTVPYNIFQLINFHFPIKSVVSSWSGEKGQRGKGALDAGSSHFPRGNSFIRREERLTSYRCPSNYATFLRLQFMLRICWPWMGECPPTHPTHTLHNKPS